MALASSANSLLPTKFLQTHQPSLFTNPCSVRFVQRFSAVRSSINPFEFWAFGKISRHLLKTPIQMVIRIEKFPPYVSTDKLWNLEDHLGEVAMGNAFLLLGGDFAIGFYPENIMDRMRVLLKMDAVLTNVGQMPVIKMGRMVTPRYDPRTSMYPYCQADTIPKLLWLFTTHSKKLHEPLEELLGLMSKVGSHPKSEFWTSHECSLLPDEQGLTRINSASGLYYANSTHMLWVGERNCQLDGAHVEFLRGAVNPIGIEVSDEADPTQLVKLIEILNPQNKAGRITIMTRMGADKLRVKLPHLIRAVRGAGQIVIWVCDPMHGNTIRGLQNAVMAEVRAFFEVHEQEGSRPGGVYLAMNGEDKKHDDEDGPRLNASQSLELAFYIAVHLKKRRQLAAL